LVFLAYARRAGRAAHKANHALPAGNGHMALNAVLCLFRGDTRLILARSSIWKAGKLDGRTTYKRFLIGITDLVFSDRISASERWA
jgi:hypothetical protein